MTTCERRYNKKIRDKLLINLNNYETRIFWISFVRLSEEGEKKKREKKKNLFNSINNV